MHTPHTSQKLCPPATTYPAQSQRAAETEEAGEERILAISVEQDCSSNAVCFVCVAARTEVYVFDCQKLEVGDDDGSDGGGGGGSDVFRYVRNN